VGDLRLEGRESLGGDATVARPAHVYALNLTQSDVDMVVRPLYDHDEPSDMR
jgi:hypothetical protein